jgi:gamma-glutamyltranspeptidase / glutathione hydrolase / leukotriene-C4 hydrolase
MRIIFVQEIVNEMKNRGHDVSSYHLGAVMTGISVEGDGFIYANSDWRKTGHVAGIN